MYLFLKLFIFYKKQQSMTYREFDHLKSKDGLMRIKRGLHAYAQQLAQLSYPAYRKLKFSFAVFQTVTWQTTFYNLRKITPYAKNHAVVQCLKSG